MSQRMTPVLGFAPDADPNTPGIFTDVMNCIPDERGMRGAPTPVPVGVDTLAAECRGAIVITKLDGSRRIFAGTQTKLYELSTTSWIDRSAGGGSYTGSVESRWALAQFGDTTLASNLVDAMQASGSGAFAAISGAPKARIVVSASNNFVMAFHTDEGTYGASPDRWWCCAQNDQTSWTPSVATGATTGRIVGVEGAIAAALPLGDYVIAYKQRATFLGQFVGATNGSWQWTLVPGSECGAAGQEAVCAIGGGAHFIVGNDDFWIFDGTRPVGIGENRVREWFRVNCSATYRYRTKAIYDRQRNVVWVSFPSTSSSMCDRTLVYHVGSKRWGRADTTIEALLTYSSPGVTIDGLDGYSSSFDDLPEIPFDSAFWQAGGQAYAAFDASHELVSFTGSTLDSSLTSCDVGDDDMVSMLGRSRLRFIRSPDAATAVGLSKMNGGDPLVNGPSAAMWDGGFDLQQSARFHRVHWDFLGDHAETAYAIALQPEGVR